jgi:hypothetical protein
VEEGGGCGAVQAVILTSDVVLGNILVGLLFLGCAGTVAHAVFHRVGRRRTVLERQRLEVWNCFVDKGFGSGDVPPGYLTGGCLL